MTHGGRQYLAEGGGGGVLTVEKSLGGGKMVGGGTLETLGKFYMKSRRIRKIRKALVTRREQKPKKVTMPAHSVKLGGVGRRQKPNIPRHKARRGEKKPKLTKLSDRKKSKEDSPKETISLRRVREKSWGERRKRKKKMSDTKKNTGEEGGKVGQDSPTI